MTPPVAGKIMAVLVSLSSTSVLATFLTQRCLVIRSWSRLPIVVWLVFAIYTDSYLFVFSSALLQNSLGLTYNMSTCDGAILLCLACYVTTKVCVFTSEQFNRKVVFQVADLFQTDSGLMQQKVYIPFLGRESGALHVVLPRYEMKLDSLSQHVIRGTTKKRARSKLYLFNSAGMLGVYLAVVILNFVLYGISLIWEHDPSLPEVIVVSQS
ncbi:hypothetical protein C2857_004385 [Epichloe festucae Fl1]|uniref:Uncharacterized protein n=1 Tax=Epichloe festucae (strain Fl1) TaxID=877507 RepID=A0A7S9KUZ9_EPIFF|nr:hypothetical protein C2857_004385 [Epichloe festucae Fl1]